MGTASNIVAYSWIGSIDGLDIMGIPRMSMNSGSITSRTNIVSRDWKVIRY